MTIYQILSLIGFPAVFTGAVGWLIARVRTNSKQTEALMLGTQALLRDRLLSSYTYCKKQGYADFDDRLNFENLYTQYHSLGANGVMDDIREKFFDLPTEKEVWS